MCKIQNALLQVNEILLLVEIYHYSDMDFHCSRYVKIESTLKYLQKEVWIALQETSARTFCI